MKSSSACPNAVCSDKNWALPIVCCSVLQCVAVCCSVLRVLQYVEVQFGEVIVSLHKSSLFGPNLGASYNVLQCVAVYCSVLQYIAECCSVLQCVAVCCSALQ